MEGQLDGDDESSQRMFEKSKYPHSTFGLLSCKQWPPVAFYWWKILGLLFDFFGSRDF